MDRKASTCMSDNAVGLEHLILHSKELDAELMHNQLAPSRADIGHLLPCTAQQAIALVL